MVMIVGAWSLTTTNSFLKKTPTRVSSAIASSSSKKACHRLKKVDPEIHRLIQKEGIRQRKGLELVASENFTSTAVMEALGSCLTNKYSEGQPGKRYYGGNEYIDQIELLCKERALNVFELDKNEWDVNVQPLSGSPANFAVYTALLNPHDRIMGLDLSHGGHLTHGHYTSKKRISATSTYFESLPYYLDEKTGLIDYANLEKMAQVFRPKLIVAGASAYPRNYDYERMREICDGVGAYLMSDMAHISGMVSAGVVDSPFLYSDVVTTTTHKSLRGPRGGMIFCKKELKRAIDSAVFPGLQGGPHNNNIGALAVCLKEAQTDEYKKYQRQIVKNCRALATALVNKGYRLISGGSDNHLMLVDIRPLGINGAMLEKVLDLANITLNKNAIIGDTNAFTPGGVRIGTPALTTRGFVEKDFEHVAELFDRGVKITIFIDKSVDSSYETLEEFINHFDIRTMREIMKLRSDVNRFASTFHMPGGIS